MATMKRCRAQLSLHGSWGSEHFWPGLEVNVDRELKPGYTIADAVRGREDAFEDVKDETTAAAADTAETPSSGKRAQRAKG